jgi:hypothetical protein
MAKTKNFSDYNGQTVELCSIHGMDNKVFATLFPGVKGFRYDGYSMMVGHPTSGAGGVLPLTRKIDYKSFPSKHECNSKCLNGKHNGACECQCGGVNHGRGMFTSLIAA